MPTTTRSIPTDPAAFLAWENRQRRWHELVNSVPRLMDGDTLGQNLDWPECSVGDPPTVPDGCDIHRYDVKVVSPGGMITYPDVMVRCGAFDEDAAEIDDPMLVVEVLSPSTRREDLIRKRYGYEAIPSLRWLLYVEPKKV